MNTSIHYALLVPNDAWTDSHYTKPHDCLLARIHEDNTFTFGGTEMRPVQVCDQTEEKYYCVH